jgi:hypothetical protein
MRTIRNITVARNPGPPSPEKRGNSSCKPVSASKLQSPQPLATEQPTAVQDQYFSIDPLKPIISKALLPFIHRSIPENAHCARKDSGFAQNRPLTRRRLRTEVRSYLNTPGCVTVGLWRTSWFFPASPEIAFVSERCSCFGGSRGIYAPE